MSELPTQPVVTDEEKKKKREEEKKRKAELKKQKELEKQQRQLELKKQQEEAQKRLEVVVAWDDVANGSAKYGYYPLIQSTHQSPFTYTKIGTLTAADHGKEVVIRARVHTVRGTGKVAFILIRDGIFFIQAVFSQTDAFPQDMAKFISKLSKESVIDVVATVSKVETLVESATQKDVELAISRIFTVSRAAALPIQVEDCMKGSQHDEEELEKLEGVEAADSKRSDLPKPIGQENRLNNRVIDMRAPAQLSVFKIQSAMGRFFREYLYTQDFTEIHTPKLIGAASEGGAEIFEVKYFTGRAYLAQSPQLYKQMAVMGDLTRVFEIGPVFRAERSHTHRHLTEFVGLDIEMAISQHYSEVLDVIDQMFIYIFDSIEKHFKKELENINAQYAFEPIVYNKTKNLRIAYPEAIALLREDGIEIGDFDDINTAKEIRLGQLVKQKYNTDFYFLERFPMTARPFYTMPCPDDERYSNSYDIFLRGEEISSGAQRIHDPELLIKKATEKGVDMKPLMAYVDSFNYGSYPHAGCGIGLERIVMLYLGIGNVRKTCIWPRDPNRLTP